MGLWLNIKGLVDTAREVINDSPPSMELANKLVDSVPTDPKVTFQGKSLEITSVNIGSVGRLREPLDIAAIQEKAQLEISQDMKQQLAVALGNTNLGNVAATHVDTGTSVESVQVASTTPDTNDRTV